MKKLHLANVYLNLNGDSDHFTVDKYKIYPHQELYLKNNKHKCAGYLTYQGNQADSIIFRGGNITDRAGNLLQPRKFIDDILLIGSISFGWNWNLHHRIKSPSFPPTSIPYLTNIELSGRNAIEQHFQKTISKIQDISWQQQFANGFHLRMLLNHANINHTESRFLSNIVIWEWLYPHLKNPDGATRSDEDHLNIVIDYILDKFWPRRTYKGKNIFHILRNQLAHSGKIPINRNNADSWMTELEWKANASGAGVEDYISFFEKLTQVVVLKTLDINVENIIKFNLDNFLKNGKI